MGGRGRYLVEQLSGRGVNVSGLQFLGCNVLHGLNTKTMKVLTTIGRYFFHSFMLHLTLHANRHTVQAFYKGRENHYPTLLQTQKERNSTFWKISFSHSKFNASW